MRYRVGLPVAAVAIVVLLVATGLGWFSGGSSVSGVTKPLAVRTSLTPSATLFGDPVVADVAVDIDPSEVSPSSVRVVPSFSPYVQGEAPAVVRSRAGGEETIHYRYALQCVTNGCLPVTKPRLVQFPPVIVTATENGKAVKTTGIWQPLSVSSRLTPADIASGGLHFRSPVAPPPASFGVSPVVADLLTAAGGLLGVAALALLGLELAALVARRRRLARARLSPLEVALTFVRQAARRPDPADRRKALGLLSDVLAVEGDPALAGSAGDAAWSEQPPSADRTLELADEVKSPVEAGSA
jgi:hypothetical protein